MQTIKNKKILITAGPTWVPLDRVRVISNVSTGETGRTIARYAAKKGADVTLLSGPVYFDELQKLLRQQLKRKKYDIIIHAAAVSDYRPVRFFDKKIKSGNKNLIIHLRPTHKIIDSIRKLAPKAFLVMFKLEVGKSKNKLIDIAYKNMLCSGADLVVANNIDDISENRHKAYIVNLDKKAIEVKTKEELAERLFRIILEKKR